MNLNHIAKKPFFDIFYMRPVMTQILRAAIYDATAVNTDGSIRGSKGTVLLKNQLTIAGSKELNEAVKEIKNLKVNGNHITAILSDADLIQIGGYAAVEYCGGPQMVFRMGRQDVEGESDAVQHEKESHYNSLNVARLQNLKLSPEDYVALIGGTQTIGFMGESKKGPSSRWTLNPYVFDNTYFQQILLGHNSRYFSTASDHNLVSNNDYKQWVEAYAQDQNLFFANYAKAHVTLSELNHDNLLGELNNDIEDGGYVENSSTRIHHKLHAEIAE